GVASLGRYQHRIECFHRDREPYSVSGEIDMIGAQTGPEPLQADVKIFCPDKSKGESYLARGFHQLDIYYRDHNQPCGYLVIFSLSPDDFQSQSVSYVTHNNKTVFFVVISLSSTRFRSPKRAS